MNDDERLDRIVEGLQQVNVTLESLRVTLAAAVQIGDDHETRLRRIERWQGQAAPFFAVATFVLGAVVVQVLNRLF